MSPPDTTIYQRRMDDMSGLTTIDVSAFPQGVYILMVFADNQEM